MDPNILNDYHKFQLLTASCNDTSTEYLSQLWKLVYQSDKQTQYSKPMPWIGMYIALASLFCILAMVADCVHGLRTRRLWFPCKYFTLNAASLTVIAIAVKLPMDLTNLMPGYVDQAAKLGSLAFMCTAMANLIPSLASMESKELFTTMIALAVLVITLVVDVCIQINTGILSYHVVDDAEFFKNFPHGNLMPVGAYVTHQRNLATVHVGLLLLLMMIYACSSLAILKSKQILESKYQASHETATKDQELQRRLLSVGELEQHVSNYWIMAQTGNPQFMTACSVTTFASGVICASSTGLQISIMPFHIKSTWTYDSDYKWSMLLILSLQFIGVIVSSIAPVFRSFACKSFKMSSIWNHFKVSEVESYWTEKLSDWKKGSIPFLSSSRKWKAAIHNVKILVLNICIGFQTIVVVACKMVVVLSFCLPICVQSCISYWKYLKSRSSGIMPIQNQEQPERNKNLSRYVLQLEDDMEFAERTLKRISKSVNLLIQEAEKQQPMNLTILLQKHRGFEGVYKFDSNLVRPLLSEDYPHCWSLPLVTLTTIAISLPNIQKNQVDLLLSGVSEGLVYVTHVEESLNATDDHLISIQEAAKNLWLDIELDNKLPKPAPQVKTAGQILQWLNDTSRMNYLRSDNSECQSVSANSMYRITETILFSYHANIDQVSQEELFAQLSSMIADILAACLTNLPQVIAMKCHTSSIEKREVSVHVAAQLLGETRQIMYTLEGCKLPSLAPNELAFIDKWRSDFLKSYICSSNNNVIDNELS